MNYGCHTGAFSEIVPPQSNSSCRSSQANPTYSNTSLTLVFTANDNGQCSPIPGTQSSHADLVRTQPLGLTYLQFLVVAIVVPIALVLLIVAIVFASVPRLRRLVTPYRFRAQYNSVRFWGRTPQPTSRRPEDGYI